MCHYCMNGKKSVARLEKIRQCENLSEDIQLKIQKVKDFCFLFVQKNKLDRYILLFFSIKITRRSRIFFDFLGLQFLFRALILLFFGYEPIIFCDFDLFLYHDFILT